MNASLQRRRSFQSNDIIHNQFVILGKLDNQKHSSKLFKGIDKDKRGRLVVIKITNAAYKEKNKHVTKILQKLAGEPGVPNLVWRGEIAPDTITVTECLGPNLKKLFLLMDKEFSAATIATIGIQVLNTLEAIHKRDYVCCNIMPKEILISLYKRSLTLYITDYKQARKVKNRRVQDINTVSHTANKAILNKFSSVNLHLGMPASKKDDLESLGYILVYFLKRGNLFDKKTKISTKEEKIKFYEQQKLTMIPEVFCQGLPTEMITYMTQIKLMQMNQGNEKIDYEYLKKLFRNLFNKHATSETFHYDWITKARTYNRDTGLRPDSEKGEYSVKSDLVSVPSPTNYGSDYYPDFNDKRKQFRTFTSEEYDSQCMDEFNDEVAPDFSLEKKFNKIQTYHDSIKSIGYVRTNSNQMSPKAKPPPSYEGVANRKETTQTSTFDSDFTKNEDDMKFAENTQKYQSKSQSIPQLSSFGKADMKQKRTIL